jgi:hypothetical protein
VPPDLRRRLAKLEEEARPHDPTPYAVEVPLDVLRADEDVLAAWLAERGVKGPVALVPPKLSAEEWMREFASPRGS